MNRSSDRHLPVVLIHGMHSRDKNLNHSSLWGRIPQWLEERGWSVAFGNEDAWGTPDRNALEIAQSIHIVRERTGADAVHLVAHSKGGLDAYRVAHLPEVSPAIASVLTLAAPLQGMHIANFLAHCSWLLRFTAEPTINHKARKMGDLAPDSMGLLKAMTTQHCAQFLKDNGPLEGVEYRSLAFVPHPKGLHFPGVRPLLIRLFDGQNDGIAPLWSTQFAQWYVYDAEEGKKFAHDDSCDLFKRDVVLTAREGGQTFSSILPLLGHHLEELDQRAQRRRAGLSQNRL